MQNVSVSSQLAAPPKAAKAANASAAAGAAVTGNTSDENNPESSSDVFGKILAQQMTAAKPGKAEAIIAAVKGQGKNGDKTEQDADAAGGVVPQVLVIDPSALPLQKLQASSTSDRAIPESTQASNLSGTLSAISGKDLPVQGGKSTDIAALQPDAAQDAVAQAGPDGLARAFEAVLADKQAASMNQDNPSQLQNTAVSSMQAPVVAQQAPTDSPQQKSITVPQQVGSADWGTGLGDKVVWMVGNQTRGAEIHLNPPALGPLEVRVSITDGQANLSFMTHHAAVREAIEAATPKLREMLGDNGIGMGSVSVDVGSFAQQQQQQAETSAKPSDPNAWFSLNGESDATAKTFTTFVQPARGRGAVDYFA
jgi:flagellar hook-length control protein FliK